MENQTRELFNQYLENQARLNGVATAEKNFNVQPSVQQRLETKIQLSSEFLKLINILPVSQLKGEKVGLNINSPIASRNDTSGGTPRTGRDVSSFTADGYECFKNNFDTYVTYAKLDAWAKFPDFQVRLTNAIAERTALDRIMIGFNGTSVANNSNLSTNTLLQDVNIGWLEKIRQNAPSQVISDGASAGANAIKVGIGAGTDFKNLDALVMDAKHSILKPWYRGLRDLVVIVSSDLVHDKAFGLVNEPTDPSEKLAADIILGSMRLGGLRPIAEEYMPPNSLLITSLQNLSIYYQSGGRRRHVKEQPELDRITTFDSSNDAYVVEEYDACALIQNITLV
jgi:P2 family phage major capsid protein